MMDVLMEKENFIPKITNKTNSTSVLCFIITHVYLEQFDSD